MFRMKVLTLLALAVLMLSGAACSTAASGADVPDEAPLVEVPGLAEIELLTPLTGAGSHPYFAWQPVDGAAYYLLVVHNRQGEPYWSWMGTETSIYLGGGQSPYPENAAGPVLTATMTWGVMAFDANDVLIAASLRRSVSP